MTKVKSFADLKAMRDELHAGLYPNGKGGKPASQVQIKIAMATCGIAAGAKQVMTHMVEKAKELGIDAEFVQTGCMGYCYAEPTLEVCMPGRENVVFGYVDESRADAILSKYVLQNEMVEGVIPMNYETID